MCRPGDCLEAAETGLLDLAEIQVIFEPAKLRARNFCVHAPFGPTDARIAAPCVREVYNRVPRLREIFERQFRQICLSGSVVGNGGILTMSPCTTLAELRGKKIAAAGPNLPWHWVVIPAMGLTMGEIF